MPKFIDWVSGLPSTVGSEINLNDKLYIYDALDPTVSKSTTVGSLLTSTNVISALITPTNIQAVLSANPTEAWEAIVPNSIEVDWITTSDQTIVDIPDYAFSRKGEIPYFGSSPLKESEIRYPHHLVMDKANNAYTWKTRPLASFNVSADFLTGFYNMARFEVDLTISYQEVALNSAFDWTVALVSEQDIANFLLNPDEYAIYVWRVGPTNTAHTECQVNIRATLQTYDIGGGTKTSLIPSNGNGFAGTILSNSNTNPTTTEALVIFTDCGPSTGGFTPEEDTQLHVYMFPSLTAPALTRVSVIGTIKLALPITITGT